MTTNRSEQMKLLDYVLPPLTDGKYEAHVSQAVSIESNTQKDFNKVFEFYAAGRAFTLKPDSVFSVYPSENAEGNFSNELPFIVLNQKSLPWQYGADASEKRPWLALIVIADDEGVTGKEITVKELLDTKPPTGTFYPSDKQPEVFMDGKDDICHIIDLPKDLYMAIMPKPEEMQYLCHAKYVNLFDTEEEVSCKDGYFSVVMGNRFIPSNVDAPKKSTVHLVSVLGYSDVSKYDTIRLCSLHRWTVFSQSTKAAGFGDIVRAIDCREIGRHGTENTLLKRGVTAKEHRIRTGETTASLYCSPLVPGDAPFFDMSYRHTADGYLIYDKDKGIFNAEYSCAWQLGRMISLSNLPMAMNILKWRRKIAIDTHKRLIKQNANAPNFGSICKRLNILKGDEHINEENDAK